MTEEQGDKKVPDDQNLAGGIDRKHDEAFDLSDPNLILDHGIIDGEMVTDIGFGGDPQIKDSESPNTKEPESGEPGWGEPPIHGNPAHN